MNEVDIAEHLPWIRALARRFHANDRDDCVQVGCIELAQIAPLFDESLGVKLTTFAARRVLGAMLDYFRAFYGRGRRRHRLAPADPASFDRMASDQPDVVDMVAALEARERVRAIVGTMIPSVRDALMDELDGVDSRQTAKRLRIGLNTVQAARSRGKVMFGRIVRGEAIPTRGRKLAKCRHCTRTFEPSSAAKPGAQYCGESCRAEARHAKAVRVFCSLTRRATGRA